MLAAFNNTGLLFFEIQFLAFRAMCDLIQLSLSPEASATTLACNLAGPH